MRRLLLTTGLCLLCLVGIAFSAPHVPGNDTSLQSSEEEEREWPSGEDSECEEYGACGPPNEDYSSEEESECEENGACDFGPGNKTTIKPDNVPKSVTDAGLMKKFNKLIKKLNKLIKKLYGLIKKWNPSESDEDDVDKDHKPVFAGPP